MKKNIKRKYWPAFSPELYTEICDSQIYENFAIFLLERYDITFWQENTKKP